MYFDKFDPGAQETLKIIIPGYEANELGKIRTGKNIIK
jgi:hypothetical protein